ncbi:hypothetical protein MXL82_04975 [Staphylococcus gallinarum]|uniref:hypothetical protein n=1 Tax=Staphylococcus gallinarum TaxID=1293 RepID=UPI002DB73B1C|nr:hypothetical protein [Staphylococcus gallinarum]MEB6242403.1 hypothetical protein [Staphylococcus gallinarum]MEB6295580.1 hypothetical protein [Staphylococcus gallinarum]
MNYGENREYKSMGRGEVRTSHEILREIELRYLEKELRGLQLKEFKAKTLFLKPSLTKNNYLYRLNHNFKYMVGVSFLFQ